MADDIDRFILDDNVVDIQSLISKMKNSGYIFTNEEKLIAKPKNVKYGCSICRLGHGYTTEYLMHRITEKRYEVLGRDISGYSDDQLQLIICLRDIQRSLYRDNNNRCSSEKELEQNVELLNFMRQKDINSKADFDKYVNDINTKAGRAKNTFMQHYILYPEDIEKQHELRLNIRSQTLRLPWHRFSEYPV